MKNQRCSIYVPGKICDLPFFHCSIHLPSGKLTWQWNIPILNRKYIFKWWIFHCYASLPEGKLFLFFSYLVVAHCLDVEPPSPMAKNHPGRGEGFCWLKNSLGIFFRETPKKGGEQNHKKHDCFEDLLFVEV